VAALAAVILAGATTMACTPDEIDWWLEQRDRAAVTGLPCAELAGHVELSGLPDHFYVVIWRESRCDPGAVNDRSGALGLTQIMPEWLSALCSAGIACTSDELLDAATNLEAASYVYGLQGPDAWDSW
jgi:soluble lytic murein transglycosylase-like protein